MSENMDEELIKALLTAQTMSILDMSRIIGRLVNENKQIKEQSDFDTLASNLQNHLDLMLSTNKILMGSGNDSE
ncbi:hypothetical protein LWC05_16675 [Acetobacter sicerae]|uniref:Uncharacterized protein n=1 Tax=Acetobacter sicerae TaxID=85325 RepID=A0ABS8W1Y7_9PROT|nr:hypothetical protein [Acetobacter sicerae]MCE0745507.1 hypothetical protein [Acetobacter sicerae]